MTDVSCSPPAASPGKPGAAVRRARFPRAKPNLLEAGRRIVAPVTPAAVPKSASAPVVGSNNDIEIKGPPPVRRVTRRVFTPLIMPQTPNSDARAASGKTTLDKPLSEAIVAIPSVPQVVTPPTSAAPALDTPRTHEITVAAPTLPTTPLLDTAGTADPPSEKHPELVPKDATVTSKSPISLPSLSKIVTPEPTESSTNSRRKSMGPPLAPPVSPAKSTTLKSDASDNELSPNVSPVKQRKRRLSSRGEEQAEAKAKRRKFKKGAEPPEKSKMTMFDLIHWNPSNNPMTYEEDDDDIAVPLAKGKAADSTNEERLAEERADDPGNMDASNTDSTRASVEVDAGDEDDCMPMPQVKIGPDGSIILDEQSLVIETTKTKKDLSSSPAVYERSSHTTYASYRKKKPIKFWSERETARFYVALSTVGTDFSMMLKLFPTRTRHELKTKFKKEDRANKCLVDRAINDHQQYNLSIFEDNDELGSEDEEEKAIKKAKAECKARVKKPPKKTKDDIKKKTRKPRAKRRATLQEVSDSESECDLVIDEEYCSPAKSDQLSTAEETVDQQAIGHDAEIDDTNADGSAAEEMSDLEESDETNLASLLKPTRSGRQPKKKPVFTISIATPKRRGPSSSIRQSNLHTLSESDESPTQSAAFQLLDSGLMNGAQQLVFFAENPSSDAGDSSQTVHMFMVSSPRVAEAVNQSPSSNSSVFPGLTGLATPTRVSVPEAVTSPPTPDHGYALTTLIPVSRMPLSPAIKSPNFPGCSGIVSSKTASEATSLS